jgi:hypothetical protein
MPALTAVRMLHGESDTQIFPAGLHHAVNAPDVPVFLCK